MSEYTEDEILRMVNAKATLNSLAREYFWERYEADPEWRQVGYGGGEWLYQPGIRSIHVGAEEISVSCSARACGRGCCGEDYRTYTFPTSYLWLDQTAILADVAAKAAAQAAEEAAEEAEEMALRAARQEKAERAKLAELQAKFKTG
jgi:hypothetical protein